MKIISQAAKFFLIWRVFLLILAFFGVQLLPFGYKFPYAEQLLFSSKLPQFIWGFANFDGVHYLTIAKSGYVANFTQVFFPLYPILIHILSPLLQGNLIISGLFISNIAFLLSIFVLNKLLKLDYNEKTVFWTLIFILFFPTSFYFGSLYTESLFFLLCLLSFYFARKDHWLLSGICGFFASLTRFIGVFLLPALFVEWYMEEKSNRKLLPLFLIPLGLILYMIYLSVNFSDPLYFIHAQPVYGAQRTSGEIILFPQVVFRYLKILLMTTPNTLSYLTAVLEALTSLLFLLLAILAFFKTRVSYGIFSFLSFILPTLTGTFSSMPRYVLILFPCFLVLAQIKSTPVKLSIAIIFLVGLIVSTALFTRGYWVA